MYFTFSDRPCNGSIHDYEIIEETDPYYWSIDEFDMLSKFCHDIGLAGQTTIDERIATSASDYPAQPTRLLDMSEIDMHFPPANGVAGFVNRSFENQATPKPAYRKTPVPTRKLMGTAASDKIEVDTKPTCMYEHILPLCTSQPTNNKHRGNATNTHFTNSLTLATKSNTISALEEEEAPTVFETKEASLSPPVYCNIDVEDAESVHEVYTI